MENIFLPKKIKVGFQKREDTYSKLLAYVIYYDEKNKLRKEVSWSGWRDKKIDSQDFDNEPISGFVLNKKVGGYVTHWNPRQTYVRVFDPRGFEFEITIPNLLWILENSNSIKGKGLEGEFVYGWSGKDLLLVPTDSPDYKELDLYNKKIYNPEKIKKSDLIIGATYKFSNNENYVYMGHFLEYENYGDLIGAEIDKKHWFCSVNNFPEIIKKNNIHYCLYRYKSVPKIIEVVDKNCHVNFEKISMVLNEDIRYNPKHKFKKQISYLTFEEFIGRIKNNDRQYFWFKNFREKDVHIRQSYQNKNKYILGCDEKTLREIYDECKPIFITKKSLGENK